MARLWWKGSKALAAGDLPALGRDFRGKLAGVIEATERRFGRLDVMVANAGIGILCNAIYRDVVGRLATANGGGSGGLLRH
jgi:NAD(P)-dependent dehydrogenase (short-subunit alcohol dehydrogenase family)